MVIDQTSLRTKGTPIVIGLTKLYTSRSVHVHTISHPLIGQVEGGMREKGWGQGEIS
jgi:hypothetical protein